MPRPGLAGLEGRHRTGQRSGLPRGRPLAAPRPGRLSPDGCRLPQTRAAEQAGLDIRVTGTSFRSGVVATGIRAGKRPDEMRAVAGHSIKSPVLWEYVRDGERWKDPATAGLGM